MMRAHLCSFADEFPDRVAEFLEREKDLSRNFREETITDLWAGAMLAAGRSGVSVDLPDEASTGADLELWFVSRKLDRSLSFVIQAKRAWCNHQKTTHGRPKRQCVTKRLDRHSFRHLDHPGGKGKPKGSQAKTLVNQYDSDGHPIYPLYAFYIPQHASFASANTRGVVLADGYGVEKNIADGLKPGSKTARTYKQIKSLNGHFLPFREMFCVDDRSKDRSARQITEYLDNTGGFPSFVLFLLSGGRVEYAHIPDPMEVAKSMSSAIEKLRRADGNKDFGLPTVREGVPREIAARACREEPGGSFRSEIDGTSGSPRWRMIFRASFDPTAE